MMIRSTLLAQSEAENQRTKDKNQSHNQCARPLLEARDGVIVLQRCMRLATNPRPCSGLYQSFAGANRDQSIWRNALATSEACAPSLCLLARCALLTGCVASSVKPSGRSLISPENYFFPPSHCSPLEKIFTPKTGVIFANVERNLRPVAKWCLCLIVITCKSNQRASAETPRKPDNQIGF